MIKNQHIVSSTLIQWYYKKNIIFPWRQSRDPYMIWISEIMLQQTQVSVAEKYFSKWMKKYSNIKSLSSANLDDLSMLWAGLGYYSRVYNIYKTVHILKKNYQYILPDNYNDLIKLPGIGDYTASAILSIAYQKNYLAVDGNLKRVFSRIKMIPKNKQTLIQIKKIASDYFFNKNAGILNQALMDLGRIICKPKNPQCMICPVCNYCKAFIKKKVHLYPHIKNKIKIPIHHVVVGIIIKNNQFLISKRLTTGMLPNLWELPGGKLMNNEIPECGLKREILEETGLKINIKKHIGKVKHQYSHFKINIDLFICNFQAGNPRALKSQKIQWITRNQIKDFAFPSATHKLFKLLKN